MHETDAFIKLDVVRFAHVPNISASLADRTLETPDLSYNNKTIFILTLKNQRLQDKIIRKC